MSADPVGEEEEGEEGPTPSSNILAVSCEDVGPPPRSTPPPPPSLNPCCHVLYERLVRAEQQRDRNRSNLVKLKDKVTATGQLVEQFLAVKNTLDQAAAERDRLLAANRALEAEIAFLRSEKEDMRKDADHSRRALAQLREEVSRLTEKLEEAQVEPDKLREEIKQKSEEVAWLKAQRADDQDVAQLRTELDRKDLLLKGARSMLRKLQDDVHNAPPRSEYDKVVAASTKLRTDLQKRTDKLRQTKKKAEEWKKQSTDFKSSLKETEEKLAMVQLELDLVNHLPKETGADVELGEEGEKEAKGAKATKETKERERKQKKEAKERERKEKKEKKEAEKRKLMESEELLVVPPPEETKSRSPKRQRSTETTERPDNLVSLGNRERHRVPDESEPSYVQRRLTSFLALTVVGPGRTASLAGDLVLMRNVESTPAMVEGFMGIFPQQGTLRRNRAERLAALAIEVADHMRKRGNDSSTCFLDHLFERLVHMLIYEEIGEETITGAGLTFAFLCRRTGDLQRARVFCFDLLRHKRFVDVLLLSAVVNVWPEVLKWAEEDTLGHTIAAIVTSTFVEENQADAAEAEAFDSLCSSSAWDRHMSCDTATWGTTLVEKLWHMDDGTHVDQLPLSDAESMILLSLELIAASRGWGWTCHELIVGRLWTAPQDATPRGISRSISLLGLLGRMGLEEPGADRDYHELFENLRVLLRRYLDSRDAPYAPSVQAAAAVALLNVSCGHTSQLDHVRQWFCSLDTSRQSELPPELVSMCCM